MWTQTEVSRRLGLSAPIIQGPFGGGISSVDLVVAVAEAGGLGSFGVHHLDSAGIAEVARQIRARTGKPFALNLWIPLDDADDPQIDDAKYARQSALWQPYFDELGTPLPERPLRFAPPYADQVEAVLEARPAVFSFVYGIPSPEVLERCKALDILTLGAATTAEEAWALEQAGVDMVVASGFEAGGHRVSFFATRRTLAYRHHRADSPGSRHREYPGDCRRRACGRPRDRGGDDARGPGGANRYRIFGV